MRKFDLPDSAYADQPNPLPPLDEIRTTKPLKPQPSVEDSDAPGVQDSSTNPSDNSPA